jgi:hypothetical protein
MTYSLIFPIQAFDNYDVLKVWPLEIGKTANLYGVSIISAKALFRLF